MQIGKLNPQGKLNFPGFQEILDFTSAGSESSVSVTVDGDTDKEYKIVARVTDTSDSLRCYLNSDSTASNYGFQYIDNTTGSVTAARFTSVASILSCSPTGISETTLLTPSGFTKTAFTVSAKYTSGTTIDPYDIYSTVWNNTSNVTLLTFLMTSGNFTSGTRITVYARRSNV